MGQGVSLPGPPGGSAGINIKELEDLTYEKSLSSARFQKTIRARHKNGLVIVKVASRPHPDFKFNPYIKAIKRERELLFDAPNALPYSRVLESELSGYLVRQYLHSSLYDRLSTRPFLDDIEKRWLAFQLLCALRDCHARNVYHGDIKTENILVTSWNWLYLSDFSSSFKKTYLPEDNPADFSFYFDISGRRTCYLAPERFLGAGEDDDGRGVTWAMDVFSAGCVIAELFVESPIFTLSQLFKYRNGEYNPQSGYFSKIEDKDIRELVTHMIQVEPESRYSAEEYLNFWRRKAFPEYFYSFLHQYMSLITDPSSGHNPVQPETTNFGDADERIDRIYFDFDKIAYFLGYDGDETTDSNDDLVPLDPVFPLQIDIPNNRHTAKNRFRSSVDDGTLIFLSLVASAVRHTARATARTRACNLMLAFAERVTDEAKLDRILPFLVVLLGDKADSVKVAALQAMTQLLALVSIVSPVNAYVFTEYIRPRLQNMVYTQGTKTKPIIRATYARCLASLAHSSLKILDMVQALRADGSIPTVDPETEDGGADTQYQNLYDSARSDLIEHFETHAKALLTDPEPSVRRAILGSVSSLCVFFGSPKAFDVILSHLNTYLNDTDWQLKCAFFQTIVGVATFVGSTGLEDFILPLMVQALTDPEEFVVEKVISSFASMAELGLFQKSKTWELLDVIARFTMHPNIWIREAAAHLISASTTYLSIADTHCIVLPLIRPYLKTAIMEFSESTILDALRRPISRPVLDMAAHWSQKVERGIFWNPAAEQRTFTFGNPENATLTISSKDLTPNSLRRVPKNDEDEQWLMRLKNLGMTTEDEFKLVALKAYILRSASRRKKEIAERDPSRLKNTIKLQDLQITPQTILFENHAKRSSSRQPSSGRKTPVNGNFNKPRTIAEALLDASSAIDDTAPRRKGSQSERSRERRDSKTRARPVSTNLGQGRRHSSNQPSPLSSSPNTRVGSWDRSSPMNLPSRLASRAQTTSERSDGTLTPTGTPVDATGGDRLKVRHKSSAISLLNRRDTPKTTAETRTDATNAIGEMDGPFTQDGTDGHALIFQEGQKRMSTPDIRQEHNYQGNDPNVLKLLNQLASENYPVDELDFGPMITPVSRKIARRSESAESDGPWRLQGVHVATFGEHTAAINRILPSPDHIFFITASEDGTVKVWDTLRLERNLVHRSRQTHRQEGDAPVKCVTFVENTHTFICCSSDGSIDVVKVECTSVGDSTKYGKLRTKRNHMLPANEYAVWCEHFRSENRSTLILATNTSRIVALDLRTMEEMYSLSNPLDHGAPTCFCLDRKHNWLLLGTMHGVLSLFDLRFRLRVKVWSLAGRSPIHRLTLHPFKGRGRWVCVSGGTGYPDISVWDIEKSECREVFRAASSAGANQPPLTNNSRELIETFQPAPVSTLSTATSPISSIVDGQSSRAPLSNAVSTFVIGAMSSADDRDSRQGFLISGGADRHVRFWDLARVEASVVVSGLAPDEPQPKFSVSYPSPGLTFNTEAAKTSTDNVEAAGTKGPNVKDRAAGSSKGRNRESRIVTMAKEQKALLRSHLDSVTDVAMVEGGVGMVISVDRKGCIYVFQ